MLLVMRKKWAKLRMPSGKLMNWHAKSNELFFKLIFPLQEFFIMKNLQVVSVSFLRNIAFHYS